MEYHLIITAIVVPLLSVIGAGILSYYTATNTVSRQTLVMQTAASYADYLVGVADKAQAKTDEDEARALAKVAGAKARIAIYGAPEVIGALAEFDRAGSSIAKNPDLFLRIATEMRKQAWNGKRAENDMQERLIKDIRIVLVGSEC